MNNRQLIGQLSSPSTEAREASLKYILRSGVLPDEVVPYLINLFQMGPPYPTELISIIMANPRSEFENAVLALLKTGVVPTQAQVLQSLDLWNNYDSSPFIERLKFHIDELSINGKPWVAFLAALQLHRLFGIEENAWARAAQAVVQSIKNGWHQDITPQASDSTSIEERSQINNQLGLLGVAIRIK
jgi:hypothetical protein